MAYVNITVDLWEIYGSLCKREKQELLDWLDEDGFTEIPMDTPPEKGGLMNEEFSRVCGKLAKSYYRMDKEDEETIIKIMKKYEFF